MGTTANKTCPLCREKVPFEEEELGILRDNAAAGKAWAQCSFGNKYYYGLSGLSEDGRKAESLFRSAADQGHSNAQYFLGRLESERDNGSEAFRLFEAAASQGHMNALGRLGTDYFIGDCVERDAVKAVRLLTVSSKLQTADRCAHQMLAVCFGKGEGGLERSMVRSTYYMKPAIEEESELSPYYMIRYAYSLRSISASYYRDLPVPPSGDNNLPEALFWYRRARAKSQNPESVPFLDFSESSVKQFCACCHIPLSIDKPKCCTECKAAYYCSRECQAADWKAGHKKDCVKSLKKRLEGDGNV